MLYKILGHILMCPLLILIVSLIFLNIHGCSVKDAIGAASMLVICVVSYSCGYDLLKEDK